MLLGQFFGGHGRTILVPRPGLLFLPIQPDRSLLQLLRCLVVGTSTSQTMPQAGIPLLAHPAHAQSQLHRCLPLRDMPLSYSCRTFSRSRSFADIHSPSSRSAMLHRSGTFYFAQRGTSHVATTKGDEFLTAIPTRFILHGVAWRTKDEYVTTILSRWFRLQFDPGEVSPT